MSELRAERTNLVTNISVLGKLDGGSSYKTETESVGCSTEEDESCSESTVGKENIRDQPGRRGETKAHNVSSGPQEDRGVPAGEMGEREAAEEGCVAQSRDADKWSLMSSGVIRVGDEFYRTPLAPTCRIVSIHAAPRVSMALAPVTVDKIRGQRKR